MMNEGMVIVMEKASANVSTFSIVLLNVIEVLTLYSVVVVSMLT